MANRIAPPPPYYRDLLALSAGLIGEGRHDLAVIVAQMVCEVLSEQMLMPLLGKRRKALQTFDVHKGKVRHLYTKLTHDPIDKAPFWAMHRTHVARRHEVVHRGRRVSPTEAQESLSVATQFVDHVENVQRSLA